MNLLEEAINNDSLPKYISFRSTPDEEFLKLNISSKKFNNYSRQLKRLNILKNPSRIIYFDILVKDNINFDDLYNSLDRIIEKSSELIFYLNDQFDLYNEILYLTIKASVELERSSIEEISKTFNRYAREKKIVYNHIDSIDDLIFLFDSWNQNNQDQKDLILEIIERSNIINQELNLKTSSSEITTTEINISRIQYDSFVKYHSKSLNQILQHSSDEVIQIFNSFKLNDDTEDGLFAIQLNIRNRIYIKFDRREKLEKLEELYDLCSINSEDNFLYFFTFDRLTQRIFQFNLNLESSIMSFRFTNNITNQVNFNEENEVFNSLSENIDLSFSEILPMKIIASFFILNISISPIIFIDMLLNDDIMNTYFFVDEALSPFSEKKRMILRMIDNDLIFENQSQSSEEVKSILIANLSIESLTRKERFVLEDDESILINPGEQIIRVNIVRADSFNVIKVFVELLKKILNYYLENRQSIIKQYKSFFPEINFEDSSQRLIKRRKQSTRDGNYDLKDYAPDVFVLGYSRECQKLRQPIPLETKDEIKKFKQEEFEFRGSRMKREVMNYPKDSNRFNFGCMNDSFPFIGVKKSNLENSSIYPYIPCCFETPQIGDDINSKYNEYYLGIERRQSQKKKFILSSDKDLDPDIFGSVDRRLTILFDDLIPSNNHSLMRYGVINDNLSIIHSVLTGMKVQEYLELNNDSEKRTYVENIRNQIINSSYPELGRQELYDHSNEEIIELLSSDEEYWNSKLIFRFIEEYFEINLIVFKEIEIQVPRFKSFHIRIIDTKRKSIVLLKKERHYELLLISRNLSFENSISSFDSDYFKDLIDRSFQLISLNDMIETDELIHSIKILRDSVPVKQFIDRNGKSFGYITEDDFIVFTKPNRPFNLIEIGDLENNDMILKSEDEVLSRFGMPTSDTSSSNSSKSSGVWYGEFFVPINNEIFDSNILVSRSRRVESIITSIHKNRIIASVLMNSIIQTQLMIKSNTVDDFFKRMIVMSNQEYRINLNSSIEIIESDGLREFFFKLNDTIEGLIDLDSMKIRINDRILYNKLFYFTRLFFQNNLIKYRDWKPRINNLLQFEEDFESNDTQVLFGVERLKDWIDSIKITKNNILKDRFVPDDDDDDIFLYFDQINQKNYFVQKANGITQAINISIIWIREEINNGLNTIEDEIEGVDYDDYSRIQSIDGILLLKGKMKEVKLVFENQKIFSLLVF